MPTDKRNAKVKVSSARPFALVMVFGGALLWAMFFDAAASGAITGVSDHVPAKKTESAVFCDATPGGSVRGTLVRRSSYVLGDSISYGLQLDGLEAKLQAQLGGTSKISFDGGRSINVAGHQIHKSALGSVDIDRAFISGASVIIIVLGTNQLEASFTQSQQQLMKKLKAVAPRASYFWVDIGATMSNQVDGWNARNKTIYDNANALGYTVISRYKAIFGPEADPLRIKPGQNFPGSPLEPGYGGVGAIHGASGPLSNAILAAVASLPAAAGGCSTGAAGVAGSRSVPN